MQMIHEKAIVHPEAQIDSDVQIGPYCIIGPKVRIGKGTILNSHVVIEGNTTLGKNNQVFPFAVLGAVPQDLKFKGEDTELIIGDHNIFRESVSIHLGTVPGGGKTVIGNHNLFMAHTHVGHDCVIGSHCIFANLTGLAGHVTVEDYANLAGMVGVAQNIRIGMHTYVTGQAGVDKDVPRFSIAFGSRPCRVRGANIVGLRRHGYQAESIQMINEAIKLWTREGVEKETCVREIEAQFGENPEIRSFLEFIQSSKSGVIK